VFSLAKGEGLVGRIDSPIPEFKLSLQPVIIPPISSSKLNPWRFFIFLFVFPLFWVFLLFSKMLLRFLLVNIACVCGLHLVSGEPIPVQHVRRSQRWIVPRSHAVHERHESAHLQGWMKRELAEADAVLPVRVGLKHAERRVEEGHQLLMDM